MADLEQTEQVLAPHERHHYSNLAYALLGEVVARLSGLAWREYVEQRLFVPIREAEPALVAVGLDLEQATRPLVLEPLPCVPLVDTGGVGELGRRERAPVGKRSVEAEDVAEIDREQIERPDRVHAESFDQRVATLGRVNRACHQLTSLVERDLRLRVGETQPVRVRGTVPGGGLSLTPSRS